MTERFHWDWKTGRMKDTYSSFQATKDMRLIERQVNDACNSYEKQIAKLEKENEQLRHDATILIQSNQDYRKENEELRTKNNAYIQDIEVFKEENTHLKLENEQLKNKIDVLEDDNETYHKSLEKLNLYTKRFIPTKCTNEFKDCKTNRYYWLDHEGNFEGCLELLNLLDCENEVLKSENSHLKAKLMEYEEQIKGDVE